MKDIIPSFKDSMFSNNTDILIDISEYTIDNLIKASDTITDFPLIKSFASVLKVGHNIYDRNLLKNSLVFIKELNSGKINKEKYMAYKSTLEYNHTKCEEEIGRVILILNNIIDTSKSKMLARLYMEYINKVLNWDEFCEYSEILNRIFMMDIEILKKIYYKNITFIDKESVNEHQIYRLNSLGVINIENEKPTVAYINGTGDLKKLIYINNIGKKFLQIILELDS